LARPPACPFAHSDLNRLDREYAARLRSIPKELTSSRAPGNRGPDFSIYQYAEETAATAENTAAAAVTIEAADARMKPVRSARKRVISESATGFAISKLGISPRAFLSLATISLSRRASSASLRNLTANTTQPNANATQTTAEVTQKTVSHIVSRTRSKNHKLGRCRP